MKGLLQFSIVFLVLIMSCKKIDNNERYYALNVMINSLSETILEDKFFIDKNIDYNFDTSEIRVYLDNVKELTAADKIFMMSKIMDKSNNELDRSLFTNKNIELVRNFKPTTNDYFLKFSSPIFSRDYKYAFIRVYTYYWGKDAVTYYLMQKKSTEWNLYLMDDWKLVKENNN